MAEKEPTNRQIMTEVSSVKLDVALIKENTEQILEAIGIFSNKVDLRLEKLEHQMGALDSSVKNYLELSDKRYLELRQINKIIFKYLKIVSEKAKVPLDLSELEGLVK